MIRPRSGTAGSAAPKPDFDRAPFLVIWELTRACQLACRHCRATAIPEHDPGELSHEEGRALLTGIRRDFGPVLVVLTGGDPLQREDLEDLVAHGTRLGLRMTLTPSATALLTPTRIGALQLAGIRRIALSLDGVEAAAHDAFRGVVGTFTRTLAALEHAGRIGLETQLNTTIHRGNAAELEAFAELGRWHGIRLWSVFMLVATGRADHSMMLTAHEQERLFRRLAKLADDPRTPFDIKTTAGQPYYRVRAQLRWHRQATRITGATDRDDRVLWRSQGLRAPFSVNDGKGVVFVDHVGDVYPSGFLPLHCGNVRRCDLAQIYRGDPLLRRLRQPETFAGKCGRCEYRELCGGSRSRAYAGTGDAFGSDPTCAYHPRGMASV